MPPSIEIKPAPVSAVISSTPSQTLLESLILGIYHIETAASHILFNPAPKRALGIAGRCRSSHALVLPCPSLLKSSPHQVPSVFFFHPGVAKKFPSHFEVFYWEFLAHFGCLFQRVFANS